MLVVAQQGTGRLAALFVSFMVQDHPGPRDLQPHPRPSLHHHYDRQRHQLLPLQRLQTPVEGGDICPGGRHDGTD